MNFSERTQVFIVAAYYRHLTEQFGERGKVAFLHGVKHYGMQRGSRMAQRAIRAGETLDYGTFCRYGEWVSSEEAVKSGTANVMEIVSVSPDFESHVTVCPWYLAFQQLGAKEAGALYCSCLDEAINQGFNGEIQFHTVQTKHHEDCCIFRVYNSGMTAETDTRKHMEFVKGFDYHCAHTFYAIGEMVRGIFEDEGEKLCGQVLGDFENEYGKEMADVIRSYEKVNFNICLEPEIKSLEE